MPLARASTTRLRLLIDLPLPTSATDNPPPPNPPPPSTPAAAPLQPQPASFRPSPAATFAPYSAHRRHSPAPARRATPSTSGSSYFFGRASPKRSLGPPSAVQHTVRRHRRTARRSARPWQRRHFRSDRCCHPARRV